MDADRRNAVFELFNILGIEYNLVEHPAVYSQADSERHKVDVGAVIFKNLFLRNADKSRFYLLSLPLEKRADLARVREALSESRLSFGDEGMLLEKLNISPGSISLLNIVSNPETDVAFLIDAEVNNYREIGVHPNDNTATVVLSPQGITKVFDHFAADYRFVEI